VHWGIFIRHNVAYIPTSAKTEAGFYLDIEPVEVAEVSDTARFTEAVKAALSRGNPTVATPSREDYGKPPLVKYAKVKSWSQLERGSSFWGISEKSGRYEFGPYKRRADRGWEEDPGRVVTLPPALTINEVIRQIVEVVQLSVRTGQ
jgi:hypothetical protein